MLALVLCVRVGWLSPLPLRDGPPQAIPVHTLIIQDAPGDTVLQLKQRQQDVLGSDVFVAKLAGPLLSELKSAGSLDRKPALPELLQRRRAGGGWLNVPANGDLAHLVNRAAHVVRAHTVPVQDPVRGAAPLGEQAKQQVLGADVPVIALTGLGVGELRTRCASGVKEISSVNSSSEPTSRWLVASACS